MVFLHETQYSQNRIRCAYWNKRNSLSHVIIYFLCLINFILKKYRSRLACGVKIKPWMNEMVVNVIGTEWAQPEENHSHNPGGYGSNGSGPTAYNKY